MARCQSLAETEQLTATLAPAMRRRLGLPRRLPDATARGALCRVPLDGLRAVLHRVTRAAWRRKALGERTLPIQVVALDGKATALPTLNHPPVQNHARGPGGALRPCPHRDLLAGDGAGPALPRLDPDPGDTNEVGHFQAAFESLVETYGGLFDFVTYDAGGYSRANGGRRDRSGQGLPVRVEGRAPRDVPPRRRAARRGERHQPHRGRA
jgi:hypothetical protein